MLENDRHHGTLAKNILENEVFKNAFSVMEDSIFEQWKNSKEEQQREALWTMIQLMTRFEATLRAAITDGAVASQELQRLNPNDKKFSQF